MVETLVRPKRRTRKKPKKEPKFNVILWNDDVHTFDYVIGMLQVLFGYPPEHGFQLAKEVHVAGKAVVFTSRLGEAEIKRDQILGFGADPFLNDSKGPLCATLEKVREE